MTAFGLVGLGVRTALMRTCLLVLLGVVGQDLTCTGRCRRTPATQAVTCSFEELRRGGGGAPLGGEGRGGAERPRCSDLRRAALREGRRGGGLTWGISCTGSPPSSREWSVSCVPEPAVRQGGRGEGGPGAWRGGGGPGGWGGQLWPCVLPPQGMEEGWAGLMNAFSQIWRKRAWEEEGGGRRRGEEEEGEVIPP